MSEEPLNELKQVAESFRRADVGEPPDAIDAAVRARARASARRRRTSAWALPAALAATVLIAFSLVLQLRRDEAMPAQDAAEQGDEPAAAALLQEASPAPPPPLPAAPMADRAAEQSGSSAAAPATAARAAAPGVELLEAPEHWLERIEALEAAGRHEDAAAERQRLEAAYPGWLAQQAAQRD